MSSSDHSTSAFLPSLSAAALALVLTACGASEPEESEPSEEASDQSVQEGTAGLDGGTEGGLDEFDDSPVGQMNAQVLELINSAEPTSADDWEDLLDEAFTDELPADDLAEMMNEQIQPAAPWELEEYMPESEEASVSIISSSVGSMGLHVMLDPDSGLMNALYFGEIAEPGESVESFGELTDQLDEVPAEVSMLVMEDGEVLYERDPQETMPISSTAKLYVLYALVQAVEAGDAQWDDTLTVTDELRSLPSGELQEEEAGYEVSVLEAARGMIAISDNTATDMLIDYLGREAVEQAVADAGHHDPSLMSPFLATGDLFQLRWGDPELGEEFLDADEDARRGILEDLADQPLEVDPQELSEDAAERDGLEWYATAEDVTAVHQALAELRDEREELTEILTANPGLVTDPEDPWWDDAAFKGGNAVEALSGSWMLSNEDGRERTVVLLVRGDDGEIQSDLVPLFGLAQDAFALEE